MRIFARTVTCSWTNGMVTKFAHSASMIRARRRDSDVYAADGKRLTPIRPGRCRPIFRRIATPVTTLEAVSAGSRDHRSRRANASLPQSNPVTCRIIETIRRTDETSLMRHVTPLECPSHSGCR
jgi:hypothetical protein